MSWMIFDKKANTIQWGKRTISSRNCAEKRWISTLQKNEIGPLNIRATTTIKLLEENKGGSFMTLDLAVIFLDMTSKAQATKEKIDKLDFIKRKTFWALKDTIKRVKQQTHNMRKYLQITYPGIYKELIFRMCREL